MRPGANPLALLVTPRLRVAWVQVGTGLYRLQASWDVLQDIQRYLCCQRLGEGPHLPLQIQTRLPPAPLSPWASSVGSAVSGFLPGWTCVPSPV